VPQFRFTDTQERVYVDRALVVSPGDVVEWPDGAPDDGQWQPADTAEAQAAQDEQEHAAATAEPEPPAPPAAAPTIQE